MERSSTRREITRVIYPSLRQIVQRQDSMFTAPRVLCTPDSWMHVQNRPVASIERVCEGWHWPCTSPTEEG